MTAQVLVEPERIESELLRLWEQVAKEKIRACLFNLIVFNQESKRTDYTREIVRKISEKYPCRVLFISEDLNASHAYLKTAVSVVGEKSTACDYIDIGVAGPEVKKVPYLLLPHLLPDLPVYLLWTEDPSQNHPLLDPLSRLAHRLIFDSESANHLPSFAEKVLFFHQNKIDTADLNWARTEGWRELIASLFHSSSQAKEIKDIRITYNEKEGPFCHLKVQSLYLLAWLSSRLGWKLQKKEKDAHFFFENQKAEIHASSWEKLGAGTIISVDLTLEDGHLYQCARIPSQYHHVLIQISSSQKCELPYHYILGKTATGQSLAKEIVTEGTSLHYIGMLKKIKNLI